MYTIIRQYFGLSIKNFPQTDIHPLIVDIHKKPPPRRGGLHIFPNEKAPPKSAGREQTGYGIWGAPLALAEDLFQQFGNGVQLAIIQTL